MIRKTQSYTDSKNVVHASLEEAQETEIRYIIDEGEDIHEDVAVKVAERIMKASAKVLDILTTKPTSRPAARAINGAKRIKKRKADVKQPDLVPPATAEVS